MRKFIAFIILVLMLFCSFTAEAVYDDTSGHWAEEIIEKWSEKGIIYGNGKSFMPDNSITRGELAVIIDRVLTLENKPYKSNFEDLDDTYYTGAIERCVVNGILNGFNNKIRPKDTVTRQEVATILGRAFEIEKAGVCRESFEDLRDVADWAKEYVYSFINSGILNGYDGKIFPQKNTTRAELIKLLDSCIIEEPEIIPVPEPIIEPKPEPKEIIEEDEYYYDDETYYEEEIIIPDFTEDTAKEEEETIPQAIWCMEAFSIGNGYIVPPQKFDIIEGENCAELIDRLITSAGFTSESTGESGGGFYLAAVLSGENEINSTPDTPQILIDKIIENGADYDITWREEGRLGEFDFSQGAGWMYSVNNIFPNRGFSEIYLKEGDVLRLQFTLCYGQDIGGGEAVGNGQEKSGFFESPSRDELIKLICEKGIENCVAEAVEIAVKIDATAEEIKCAEGLFK